jgi:putative RecB family exonuclease
VAPDLPRSLSPSKVTAFTDCPLAFRLAVIDRVPELPSPHAVKGNLVHATLERLFCERPAGARTYDNALCALELAWADLQSDPEFIELALDEPTAVSFFDDAKVLVENYFRIEDPNAVHAVGVELGLETELNGTRLRGIIDRLDLNDDGDLVVIDYKTGRAPSAQFERSRLTGVQTYASLCQRVFGRPPVEVKLLYLRDPVSIVACPTEQSLRANRQKTIAVWSAIERACERDDFQPRPSGLCRHCSFQQLCPAYVAVGTVSS